MWRRAIGRTIVKLTPVRTANVMSSTATPPPAMPTTAAAAAPDGEREQEEAER